MGTLIGKSLGGCGPERVGFAACRARQVLFLVVAAVLLAFPVPARAASPAFVQVNAATPQSPQSSVTVAYGSAQAAGDLNIVAVGWGDATSSVSSVTDSLGNTYSLAIGPTRGTGLSQSIYYARNIKAGSNTVTVKFTAAAAFPDIRILEYKGVDTGAPLDVKAGAAGSGANGAIVSSGAATTANANDLIFGAGTTSWALTAGSGFTSRIKTGDSNIAEDMIVTATGSHAATATLSASGTQYWVMQMAAFKGAVTGPAVGLSAGSLDFGNQAVGTTSAPLFVTVTNTGSATLNFPGNTISGDFDWSGQGTCGASLAPGAQCTLAPDFKPTAAGTRTGAITITDNAANSPQTISLTGTGGTVSGPVVSLSPSSLTFPSQAVGTVSAPQYVTITNTGNATLSMSTTISGDFDWSGTGTCVASLAAGANCTLAPDFKPTATGTRTGALTITDNAPGSPHVITLTGAGTSTSDTTPPTAPTGLSGTGVSSSEIKLTWGASSDNVGVAGYQITRGMYTYSSPGTGTSYTVSGLNAGTSYSFTAKAYDAAGNYSNPSNTATATTQGTGGSSYSLSNPPPAGWYPYVSSGTGANGNKALFNQPLPGNCYDQTGSTCSGGIMTHSIADTTAKYVATGGGACNETTAAEGYVSNGCGFWAPVFPAGDSGASNGPSSDQGIPIYYCKSDGSDCVWYSTTNRGLNVKFLAPNKAMYSGGDTDMYLGVYDQKQHIALQTYTYFGSGNAGRRLPASSCPGTGPSSCATPLDLYWVNAGAVGTDADYYNNTNYSELGYTLGGSSGGTTGLSASSLGFTIRFAEESAATASNYATINHAMQLGHLCGYSSSGGSVSDSVFPQYGGLLACSASRFGGSVPNTPTQPKAGQLFIFDYTKSQIDAMRIDPLHKAMLRAYARYGGYFTQTGQSLSNGYTPSTTGGYESLTSYFSTNTPFPGFNIMATNNPHLAATCGSYARGSCPTTKYDVELFWSFSTGIGRITGPGGTDNEGNSCSGTGGGVGLGGTGGCYPSGHMHVIDSCVPKGIVGVAGGC